MPPFAVATDPLTLIPTPNAAPRLSARRPQLPGAPGLATVTALCLALTSSQAAPAQSYEVHESGREAVWLSAEPARGGGGAVTGLPGIPFGAIPDWQNTLRRQVGGLVVADMNGDGRPDVVVGCYSSASFPPYDEWKNYIYYNTGAALADSPGWTSDDQVSTGHVFVGDLNDDGYPDIFAANGGTALSPCVIYFGGPGGPATAPGWSSAVPGRAWTNYAALHDFDGDGYLDVLTANQGLDPNPFRPMFLFRNHAGQLDTIPSWQSAESSIQGFLAVADYDGDGWDDVAVSKWVNFQSGIYRNESGLLESTPAWTTGQTTADRGVAWADVDGNGWPDLVLGRNPTTLYGNTAGTLAPAWTAQAPFYSHQDILFADIDRDGDEDLLEVHFSDGRTHLYLNHNGVLSTTPSWTYDSTAVGTAIAVGDLNGDRWPDLVIGYSGQPSVVVFYNQLRWPRGDMNCDRIVNFDDVDGFIAAVLGPESYAAAVPWCDWINGDIDASGTVDFDDIGAFVACLISGSCEHP